MSVMGNRMCNQETTIEAQLKTVDGKPLRTLTMPRYNFPPFVLFAQRVFQMTQSDPREYTEVKVWIDPMPPVIQYPPYNHPSEICKEPSPESLAEIPEVKDWSGAVRGKFYRPKTEPICIGLPSCRGNSPGYDHISLCPAKRKK